MAERWYLGNAHQLQAFTDHAKDHLPFTIELVRKVRNADQNALFHAVLREVQAQKRDESIEEIKRYCKLHFGVPILRSDDPTFCALYDKAIKDTLSYEEKLLAMDVLPVTSRMDTEQMSRLIDNVVRHYTAEGYSVRMPD